MQSNREHYARHLAGQISNPEPEYDFLCDRMLAKSRGMMTMLFDLRRYGEAPALLTESGFFSYNDLAGAAEGIANSVKKRSLAFLFCKNTPASIAGYVGFINNGIVPVMVDAELDAGLLRYLVKIYAPSYFWLPESKIEIFPGYDDLFHWEGYALLAAKEQQPFPLHDDLALLMTTSGSTGSPKLVRLSYANLASNTESIVKYLEINSRERSITNLPMHYVYGLSIINTHLFSGASLVATERSLFQREFWQLFKDEAVTNFGGVPYTFEMLKRLRFFRMDLPDLQTITQAGGKLDPELHREFAQYAEKTGKRFIVMYGAAEATARMGYLPAEDALRKSGSMGVAIPGGRFELADDDGNMIETPDQPGELVYYGSNVMMGYAESGADLIRGDEQNHRLMTGDIASRDREGYYTIVGRKKRFLKMFGKRTNLQEVEHLLRQHFQISDVVCAGVDDHMYLFVTDNALQEQLIPYLSQTLGLHPTAFCAKCIPSIPKNQAGKTLYRELEQYYDV